MKSRWDSLKPDSKNEGKNRRNKTPGAPKPSTSLSKHTQQAHAEIRHDFVLFQEAYVQSKTLNALENLSNIIQTESDNLSFGLLLSDCVVQVFIPRLEEIHANRRRLSGKQTLSNEEEESRLLYNILKASLQNDNVSSTLFAPSIDAAYLYGPELQQTNPAGLRLTVCLAYELQSSNCQSEAVECLSKAIEVKLQVEGFKSAGTKSSFEVNPRVVYRSLEDTLLMNDHCKSGSILRLVQALVKRNSEASSPFLSCVLIPKTTSFSITDVTCPSCGIQPSSTSVWLQTLHDNSMPSNMNAALTKCTILLLEHAPLSLWLQESSRPSRTTISSFRDKIEESLICIIRISICRLLNGPVEDSSIDLAGCILLYLPFAHNKNLVGPAVLLVEKMVGLWRKSTTSLGMSIVHALVMSMGGQTTPSGLLTTMSIPIQSWLVSENGKAVVMEILMTDNLQHESSEHKFLLHAVRTLPSVCLGHSSTWEAVIRYIDRYGVNGDAAELVRAILQGRRDLGTSGLHGNDGELVNQIAPRLHGWLASPSNNQVRCAIESYSLLDHSDWVAIVGSETLKSHLDSILAICKDKRTGQKTRGDAYKSLGEICTNLVPAFYSVSGDDISGVSKQCNRICRVLLEGLDGHKNTAYMAMFGLGNLAYALFRVTSTELLDENLLESLAKAVLLRLDSEDPKLATNTIRAASHVLCLTGRMATETKGISQAELAQPALQNFCWRISQAVALSRGELTHLSWKQRNAVKKSGWGACNALSTIFSSEASSAIYETPSFHASIENLCQCVIDSEKMNDKVLSAAMSAIRSVDQNTLGRSTEGKSYFTQAVISLVDALPPCRQDNPSKTQADRDLTLKHLLEVCSIGDARNVVKEMEPEKLGILFEWTVNQRLPAEVMGRLSLAMQRCQEVDLYWEHRFRAQAQALLYPDDTADEL